MVCEALYLMQRLNPSLQKSPCLLANITWPKFIISVWRGFHWRGAQDTKVFEVRWNIFVMPTGQNHSFREHVLNAKPIQQKFLALCPNGQYNGRRADTPLAIGKHNLKRLRKMLTGAHFVQYSTPLNAQVYYAAIQPLNKLETFYPTKD